MKVENMSVEQLYKRLESTIINIYNEYGFMFNEEEYHTLIIKSLNRIKKNNKYELIDGFDNYLKKLLDSIIREKLNNDNSRVYVVDEYINFKIKDISTYSTCLKEFQKLSQFFNHIGYAPDIQIIEEVIGISALLNQMLQIIVNKNKKAIKSKSLDMVFEDNILKMFIEAYCIINGFEMFNANETMIVEEFKNSEGLLTIDEERYLIQKIKNGDLNAKNIFIEKNMGLVKMVAKGYRRRGVPFEDLVQEGCIGLIKAVDGYDLSKGCKFSTYAVWQIRASIIRCLENTSKIIRLPNNVFQKTQKYAEVKRQLSKEMSTEPTVEDIAKVLKMSVEKTCELQRNNASVISLNEEYDSSYSRATLEDFIPAKENVEEDVMISERDRRLYEMLEESNISKRDIEMLFLSLKEDYTLKQLGKVFGMTDEGARQALERTKDRIRLLKQIGGFAIYMDNPENALEMLEKYRKEIAFKGIGKTKSF